MRKIDYQLLANTIKRNFENVEQAKPAISADYHDGFRDATLELAVIFSDHAHVDKEKFLMACGIKP